MEGVDLRQYLIRIAVIQWLLSLFRANPDLCTNESLMQELAEWLWSDVCCLEGCDNPLLGYRSDAFFCCDVHRVQSPERKAYMLTYGRTPERKAYHKKYNKVRQQTPEVKAKEKARRQTPKRKAYMKAYMKAWYLRKKAAKLAALASQ